MIKNNLFRSLVFSSALALWGQEALANKPLPCPTDSPLVDKVWVVTWEYSSKIINRLNTLDREKHHQISVITVDNVQEYWYGTIEEMANVLWNTCKVWYRWVDTGVVVLYTKNPSLYRIDNAWWVQWYITDLQSGRIIKHSKTPWVCEKSDVACRLDDITDWLTDIIYENFAEKESVDHLRDTTNEFDQKKKDELLAKVAEYAIWFWIVILLIWWWVVAKNKIVKNSKIKKFKRKVLELKINIEKEKTKYPKWFIENHINNLEIDLNHYNDYSNGKLDYILKTKWAIDVYLSELTELEGNINKLDEAYKEIISQSELEKQKLSSKIVSTQLLINELEKEWFKFSKPKIPEIPEWNNPEDTLKSCTKIWNYLDEETQKLWNIKETYTKLTWYNETILKNYKLLSQAYNKAYNTYIEIFWNSKKIDLDKIEIEINKLSTKFTESYNKKDIDTIISIVESVKNIEKSIHIETNNLDTKISWYISLPNKLSQRKKNLEQIKFNSWYVNAANEYRRETWNSKYDNFDMVSKLLYLATLMDLLNINVENKKDLDKVDSYLIEFDTIFKSVVEYIWLNDVVNKLIEERLKKERERKRREEEEKRRKEKEAEEEEKNRRNRNNHVIINNDDDNSPISGWGWWFDWWGATDD